LWTKFVLTKKLPSYYNFNYHIIFVEIQNSLILEPTMKSILGNAYNCYDISSLNQIHTIENTFTYIGIYDIITLVLDRQQLIENGFNVD